VRPDTHTRKLAAINTEITWSASLSSPEFTPSVSTLSQELQGLYSQHVCTNKRVLSKENSSKGFIFVWAQKVMPNWIVLKIQRQSKENFQFLSMNKCGSLVI